MTITIKGNQQEIEEVAKVLINNFQVISVSKARKSLTGWTKTVKMKEGKK